MEHLTELPPLSPAEIDVMNGFWEWIQDQPRPSPYKPVIMIKVKRNSGIKELRDKGHKYFDMIWRELRLIERNELYAHLASWLNLSEENAHFRFFNPEQCIKAIEFSIQKLNDDRRLDMDLTGVEPRPYFELTII